MGSPNSKRRYLCDRIFANCLLEIPGKLDNCPLLRTRHFDIVRTLRFFWKQMKTNLIFVFPRFVCKFLSNFLPRSSDGLLCSKSDQRNKSSQNMKPHKAIISKPKYGHQLLLTEEYRMRVHFFLFLLIRVTNWSRRKKLRK